MWLQRGLLLLLLVLSLFSFSFYVTSAHDGVDTENDIDFEEAEEANLLHDLDHEEEDLTSSKSEESEPETPAELPEVKTVPYVKPSINNLEFVETFDGDIFSRWIKSGNSKFIGEWEHALRATEALLGDKGLKVVNEALHHGISRKLPSSMQNNKGQTIVISYEVKFEETLNCGGAYLKLFDTSALPSKGSKMSEFDNETPYIVMFGPDRCLPTNKVHLIIKQLNPVSNKWIEHHLVDPPRVPHDTLSHVYTAVLKPNDTYELFIDNKSEKSGNMKNDFEPPFTPPEEIDDPNDLRPDDWVDQKEIPDPNAAKPDDWDEDAPRTIPDPEAVMPEGWLEKEEKMVPDSKAKKPEDWDEEEDGKWTPPLIQNPACESAPGCGPWVRPMVPNPSYKGKWSAPMIPNPAYKGEWKPQKIQNPDYFESKQPHAISDFDAVGFELWTMQKGILFDNIVIARSFQAVESFVNQSWKLRHDIEVEQQKLAAKPPLHLEKTLDRGLMEKVVGGVMTFVSENPLVFGVGSSCVVLISIISIIKLLRPRVKSVASQKVAAEHSSKKTNAKDSAKSEEEEEEKGEGDDEVEEEQEGEEGEGEDEQEEEGSERKKSEELKGKQDPSTTRQRRAKKD